MHELFNPQLLTLAAMMLLTGAAGGVIAGMLGVGGGIVIVPVLDLVLASLRVDPSVRMHVVVATSLATIIPTAISSSRAHEAKGAVDRDQLKRWGIAIFLGAIAGVLIASRVTGDVLSAVFGVVALLVALKMLLPLEGRHIGQTMPGGVIGQAIPFSIGGISSMMGIGGGTLSVPVMTLYNVPIHRAVGTAALFGLLISAPATVAFIITGWNVPGLPPGSLGYVNLIGLAIIGPATFATAPLGARIAHALSKRQLSIMFGLFLTLVGVRMLIRAFG